MRQSFREMRRAAASAQRQAGTARQVLADFPAGHPRGSQPAEERAAELTASGTPAEVVMNLADDKFYVVKAGEQS